MNESLAWEGDEDEEVNGDMTEYEPIEPLLISGEAAADLLCISQKTLWRLVRRDRIRCVVIVAAGFRRPIRRFRIEDIKAFVDGLPS